MRARIKAAGKETLSWLGKVNLEPLVAGLLRRREAVFENIALWRTLERKEGVDFGDNQVSTFSHV